MTSPPKWTLLGGAYVLMTANTWLAYFGVPGSSEGESMLAFSPFNLDALDASWVLPPIIWALTLLGFVVSLHLFVGAWRHVALPVVDRVGVLVGLESTLPAPVIQSTPAPSEAQTESEIKEQPTPKEEEPVSSSTEDGDASDTSGE